MLGLRSFSFGIALDHFLGNSIIHLKTKSLKKRLDLVFALRAENLLKIFSLGAVHKGNILWTKRKPWKRESGYD